MAVIDPPGKPLSVPHESWRYCDTARAGSSADAETAKQTPASPAMAHLRSQRLPKSPLRKVLKLLTPTLVWFLLRIFFLSKTEKNKTKFPLTRPRNGKGDFS